MPRHPLLAPRLAAPGLIILSCGCTGATEDTEPASTDSAVERVPWSTPPPTVIDAPPRLIGFSDVHGDFEAARSVLKLAGLIDDSDQWIGGDTVAVQTGDQLDRGDGERAILDLFESLSEQAWAAGGGFYPLLGNHETMNVELDFRYVTDGGWEDFADIPYDTDDAQIMAYDEDQRGRVAAFQPGGPYALMLAGHNLTMQVGDTVFVHGGILSSHAEAGLETINADVQAWMRGETGPPDTWIHSSTAPVWTRDYSDDPDSFDCAELTATLEILGASRMVVGHTVQDVANPACDGKVWLMDVGMADYYGGSPAALEIVGDAITVVE
jgi:hypothetical protein